MESSPLRFARNRCTLVIVSLTLALAACARPPLTVSADPTTTYPDYALFNGSVTSGLLDSRLVLHEISYVPPGRIRLSCTGYFRGNYDIKGVSVPLSCNDGIQGTATFARDIGYACYSGGVTLSNGWHGNMGLYSDIKKCPISTGG